MPLEVVVSPPPSLLRRIAERMGGRPPPRVVVLALPLAPDPGPPADDGGTVAVRAEGRRDFVTEFLAPLEPSPPLFG